MHYILLYVYRDTANQQTMFEISRELDKPLDYRVCLLPRGVPSRKDYSMNRLK